MLNNVAVMPPPLRCKSGDECGDGSRFSEAWDDIEGASESRINSALDADAAQKRVAADLSTDDDGYASKSQRHQNNASDNENDKGR